MGSSFSKKKKPTETYFTIRDKFHTIDDVQNALRKSGLESSNLILGIDYTKSNTWTGKNSFNGQNLHLVSDEQNPYQRVISVIANTLEIFDDDKIIPCYGFGDVTTGDHSVFSFFPDRHCIGVNQVLLRYNEITPYIAMSGPTSFGAIIEKAVSIVKETKTYHILVIITDGAVENQKATIKSINDASEYPLSIICVGVGDGPWDVMEKFDDYLVDSRFDNFQFVNFEKVTHSGMNPDVAFAIATLQEIPEQYNQIKKLNLKEKLKSS